MNQLNRREFSKACVALPVAILGCDIGKHKTYWSTNALVERGNRIIREQWGDVHNAWRRFARIKYIEDFTPVGKFPDVCGVKSYAKMLSGLLEDFDKMCVDLSRGAAEKFNQIFWATMIGKPGDTGESWDMVRWALCPRFSIHFDGQQRECEVTFLNGCEYPRIFSVEINGDQVTASGAFDFGVNRL